MKQLVTFLAFSLISGISFSQVLTPVDWSFDAQKSGENEFVITFTAEVDEGWVIYSQYLESDDGPIATEFTYEDMGDVQLSGENEEYGELKESYDKIFDMVLKKLTGKVDFKQKVKGKSGDKITGYLTYMTCDDERCLPPTDVDFDIVLP